MLKFSAMTLNVCGAAEVFNFQGITHKYAEPRNVPSIPWSAGCWGLRVAGNTLSRMSNVACLVVAVDVALYSCTCTHSLHIDIIGCLMNNCAQAILYILLQVLKIQYRSCNSAGSH